MNLFFHVASAVAAGLLVYWLLRVQRQRNFLRELLSLQGAEAGRRVYAEAPLAFLARVGAAFGVPFEAEGIVGPAPVRIAPEALVEFFLRQRPTLIRCVVAQASAASPAPGIVVELVVPDGGADDLPSLDAAFANAVRFRSRPTTPSSSSPGRQTP